MSETVTHRNLLATSGAGPAPTLLPAPVTELAPDADHDAVVAAVIADPAASLGWAVLAEESLTRRTAAADVQAYAFARTGYHRGLDALRRSGWKGAGPVPWEHRPNHGFLRALWSLARAARRIGDEVEYERCAQLLRDSTETGYQMLTSAFPLQ
ncbi:MAG: DUF3151 domain-containing protein [Microlunatus sp.]|nr:DUF3151 domain-containing protein [Microlunatus sp.]MDN5771716.1 DUF3151 domain-containing protein [Microlunatus sp.]MDN5803066.1 DUF3151 domain-containing protein [Microlunatus sp.]